MIDTPESTPHKAAVPRSRRRYSAQFKSEVIQACLAPGATTRGVAQRYGLLRKAEHTYKGKPIFPVHLTPRERLVAWFDYENIENIEKLDNLKYLNESWVKQQLQDKSLSWYASAGKERQKCEIAWMWYQEHHRSVALRATEFSSLENILEFLDGTTFSHEEKLHHLEQIKRRFKAKQTQANRQGKRQTNLSLSDAARTQLDQLAKRERMSKTEIIEFLIQNAHERGL